MARKVCNNKVEITACGKSIVMRLSDGELKKLRNYSDRQKGEDWERMTMGNITHVSLYALFDYAIKSPSKTGRIHKEFPFHDFENAWWYLKD
jgi:hypothetical protein